MREQREAKKDFDVRIASESQSRGFHNRLPVDVHLLVDHADGGQAIKLLDPAGDSQKFVMLAKKQHIVRVFDPFYNEGQGDYFDAVVVETHKAPSVTIKIIEV